MLPILSPPKLDLNGLARVQEKIARAVVQKDGFKKLETVAGCDISFAEKDKAYAACAVLSYDGLKLLRKKAVRVKVDFPYIPTFLAFRETEGLLRVLRGMEADVYMVGAHGLAHPRRAGLACHIGVLLDRPTLGVAKSKLVGEAKEPAKGHGSCSLVKDGKETIGAAVRTRSGGKPVYVSVGHRLELKTAVRIALETTRSHLLPEPLQMAHELATKAMREKI